MGAEILSEWFLVLACDTKNQPNNPQINALVPGCAGYVPDMCRVNIKKTQKLYLLSLKFMVCRVVPSLNKFLYMEKK